MRRNILLFLELSTMCLSTAVDNRFCGQEGGFSHTNCVIGRNRMSLKKLLPNSKRICCKTVNVFARPWAWTNALSTINETNMFCRCTNLPLNLWTKQLSTPMDVEIRWQFCNKCVSNRGTIYLGDILFLLITQLVCERTRFCPQNLLSTAVDKHIAANSRNNKKSLRI